jgi:hypothetical protein
VNIFKGLQKLFVRGFNTASGKAAALRPVRKSSSPLADQLLADALRMAEIPSPTDNEEQRAAFVMERLQTLGLSPWIDEMGNVLVRLHAASLVNEPPLLLFSDLGSNRWHPLGSLSRLDADNARGAGLAEVLGIATLLSIAGGVSSGRLKNGRDLLLLFAARSFDDPECDVFRSLLETPINRPFAGIGIRGLMLGALIAHTKGTYRIGISLKKAEALRKGGAGADDTSTGGTSTDETISPNLVVDTLMLTARTLSGITWDSEGSTHFYIRRIEAAAAFGYTPEEGILEVELESSDGKLLDMAMNTVRATAEKAAQDPALRIDVQIKSFIPVGDGAVNKGLLETVAAVMKELRIKQQEEAGPDNSAFLSNQGIPALSLAVALGQESRSGDVIEIDSIEKGRQLMETVITRITAEERAL